MTEPAADAFDFTSDDEASAFDELPLWAAPFGLRLLELVRLAPDLSVLDVGCGSGFPLVELAQRLGPGAKLHGLDPWAAGRRRAAFKSKRLGLTNVQVHEGVAEQIPFRGWHVRLRSQQPRLQQRDRPPARAGGDGARA